MGATPTYAYSSGYLGGLIVRLCAPGCCDRALRSFSAGAMRRDIWPGALRSGRRTARDAPREWTFRTHTRRTATRRLPTSDNAHSRSADLQLAAPTKSASPGCTHNNEDAHQAVRTHTTAGSTTRKGSSKARGGCARP
eukprot:5464050-Prymnesium_polylepis.1